MSNSTQTFKLYEVLKSGEPVTVEKIASELAIKILSVPVYIHGLKSAKAEIKAVREGRKVIAYQMTNAADVKVSEFRKNSAVLATKVSVLKPIISTATVDELAADVGQITDKELSDIGLNYAGYDSSRGHQAE